AAGVAGLLQRLADVGAGDAAGDLGAGAGQLRDDLLHRPAWRDVDDGEIDHHDREQRRDHQEDAANDVGAHDGSVPHLAGPPGWLRRPRMARRSTTYPTSASASSQPMVVPQPGLPDDSPSSSSTMSALTRSSAAARAASYHHRLVSTPDFTGISGRSYLSQ